MRCTFGLACRIALATCVALMGCATLPTATETIAAASSTWYWQNPLPRGYQLSAIACPSAKSCAAVGIDGSIARTDDSGQHWTNRGTGIASGLVGLSCPDPTVCYALGTQGPSVGGLPQKVHYLLLQSTDGGATWQVASHVQGNDLGSPNDFSCPSPTTCLIGVGQYGQPQAASILRTADSGKTWQAVHLAGLLGIQAVMCPTMTACYALGANNSGSRLFRSDDGGRTWGRRGLKTPGSLPTIACPGENTCFGAASTCNAGCWGIFLTTNGAKSWKEVADNPAGHPLGALACPSVTTCYVLAASGSNFYNTSVVRTTNGGKTWSVHHLPDSAFEIACPSQTACFLNAGFTVLATQDGFAHTRETLARSVLHSLRLTDMSCPSTTACYAAGLRGVCDSAGRECDQVASSGAATADAGQTWTTTPAPPYLFVRLSCPGPAVCYGIGGPSAGQENFLARSRDGTRTWRRVLPIGSLNLRPPVSAEILYDLSCVTVMTCYVTALMAPAGFLAVLVTHDGGERWTVRSEIDRLAPGRAGLAQTAPGRHRGLFRIACTGIRTCFVLAATFRQSTATVAMLFTGDGGKTWARKSVPQMNAGTETEMFAPPLVCPTVTTCYLLLSNGSTLAPFSTGDVLVTTNGGATWHRTVVRAKAILTDIACPSVDACWVAGWDGIFATADGGKTWQRQVMADGTQVSQIAGIACPAADTCYAVGGSFGAAVTIIGTRAPEGTP